MCNGNFGEVCSREYPPTNREYYWNFVANAVQRYRDVIHYWGAME